MSCRAPMNEIFGLWILSAYSVQSRVTNSLTNLDMQIKFSSFLNYWSDFPHKSHSHSRLCWIVEEARNQFVSLSLGFIFSLWNPGSEFQILSILPLLLSRVASRCRQEGLCGILMSEGRGPWPNTGSWVCTSWNSLRMVGPVPPVGILPEFASKVDEFVVLSFSAVRAFCPSLPIWPPLNNSVWCYRPQWFSASYSLEPNRSLFSFHTM